MTVRLVAVVFVRCWARTGAREIPKTLIVRKNAPYKRLESGLLFTAKLEPKAQIANSKLNHPSLLLNPSIASARQTIKDAIKYYNNRLPRSLVDMLTPSEAHHKTEELKKHWKWYCKEE